MNSAGSEFAKNPVTKAHNPLFEFVWTMAIKLIGVCVIQAFVQWPNSENNERLIKITNEMTSSSIIPILVGQPICVSL